MLGLGREAVRRWPRVRGASERCSYTHWRRPRRGIAALVMWCLMASCAWAQGHVPLSSQLRNLEADTAALLVEHYRFEESLLAPDNDRLTVFLSLPYGSRIILKNAALSIDGRIVLAHVFSLADLESLRDRATTVLYAGRIPPGDHVLRLDLNVFQGEVRPMRVHMFRKGPNAKFIHLQIDGSNFREVVAADW